MILSLFKARISSEESNGVGGWRKRKASSESQRKKTINRKIIHLEDKNENKRKNRESKPEEKALEKIGT